MNVIVVGAGGTARELLRRLGDRWDVVLVDPDEAKLEARRPASAPAPSWWGTVPAR